MTNQTGPGSDGHEKHPQNEEWMGFLYGEISRREKARLKTHLDECAECRAQVEIWRSTMEALDEGKTNTFPPRIFVPQPWLKWGIAAAIVLFIGFGLGRVALGKSDTEKLRASLKAELIEELKQQEAAQFASFKEDMQQQRELDNKAIYRTFGKALGAQQADIVTMREHLERVALTTQSSLQYEQQQIVNLANNTDTANSTH